jgi:hypothetical protein
MASHVKPRSRLPHSFITRARPLTLRTLRATITTKNNNTSAPVGLRARHLYLYHKLAQAILERSSSTAMADTSLTLEGGQAKHCQAQLTRLQRALGVKKEIHGDGELIYGQNVPAVDPDKPTNFDRKGDVDLASLNLAVREEHGLLTEVIWGIRTFDTAVLGEAPPKDCVQLSQESRAFGDDATSSAVPKRELKEQTLGCMRCAINNALEHFCLDHCGNPEHQN